MLSIVNFQRVLWVGTAESEDYIILRLKLISLVLACSVFGSLVYGDVVRASVNESPVTITAAAKKNKTSMELMWNNATDEQRYYMDTAVKAHACGISEKEFKFFARVVEGEGAFCEDDITDKVLIACTVLNRINCKRWPTKTVTTTLQRNGQFLAVDQETKECYCSRTLDAEWAIVLAYRLVAAKEIDCHMVYYNSIGFTGYSRQFTNYVDCGYCKGNYFSVIDCSCSFCTEWDADWVEDEVEMIQPVYERPIGSITKDEIVYLGRN